MAETIFFSWQLDTPTITGRNFIERALERAIGRLNDAVELDEPEREELALDRDTKGVAGQPPIVETIFKKIDATAVFVPDLTFVGSRADGRPTPNPNVLIEYGWALKSLGHGRIVPVMNVAHGEPKGDSLPFDMRHLRFPITYNLPPDATEELRKTQRESLVKELESALRAVIEQHGLTPLPKPEPKLFPPAQSAAGPARFRSPGVSLGIRDMRLPGMPAGEIVLRDGSAAWLRVMPLCDPGRTWTTTELRRAGVEGGRFFLAPMLNSYGSLSYLRADDGFGVFASTREGNSTDAITFVFETGEVWSVDSYIIPASKRHAGQRSEAGVPLLENEFRDALKRFSDFLEHLELTRPFRWIAGMEGVKGCGLFYEPPPGFRRNFPGPAGQCVADVIVAEGTLSEGESVGHALKPFFVKVFSKFGLDRAAYPGDANEANG